MRGCWPCVGCHADIVVTGIGICLIQRMVTKPPVVSASFHEADGLGSLNLLGVH